MPSEILIFQNNINQVTGALSTTRGAVSTAIKALEITENALNALEKIDTNATALESIASGLETALVLVSKLSGPVGSIVNALKRAIDVVEDRAADVRAAAEAAKPAESQFTDILNLVKAEKLVLEAQVILIDAELKELGSVKDGLADAVDVVENTEGFDIPTEFNSAIAAANATVLGINQGYQPIIDALDTVQTAQENVANALNGIIEPGRAIMRALYDITNIVDSLNFLSGPLGELQSVLEPVQWALDAIEFIYNNTIGLVVNPIIDALGVTDLFSDILDDLGLDRLPTLDIFPDFGAPLDSLIAELQGNVIDPLVAAIDNLSDQILGTDLLGPVNENPTAGSELVIGDDDNPPPDDEPGTLLNALAGDDLVAGGLGDDTLIGGTGNDLLIGGFGDDVIDGGDGVDGAVFFGNWEEFRFGYGTDDALIVTHQEFSGGRQGSNRLLNIEKVIFSNRTFDIAEFEDFFYTNSTPTQGDSIRGDDDPNYIFGNIGRDTLYGEGGDDYLFGGRGNEGYSGGRNTLYGGDGDDILDGGSFLWNDYFGGAGTDTVTYETYGANGSGNSILYLALTNDAARTPFTPEFYETYNSIENLTNGSDTKGWIWGDAVDNVLTGGDLQDRINGFAGDDTLIGGQGRDQLVGGAGDDYVDGGEGRNLFIAGPGDDTYVHSGNVDHELWYGGISERSYNGWSAQAYNWRAVENSETVETNDDFVRLAVMGFLEQDVPSLIPARIEVNLETGVVEKFDQQDNPFGTDTLVSIDTVTGSQGNDTFYGATFQHEINGGGGNDLFIGVDQDEEQFYNNWSGDAGNDTFRPGVGLTSINGGDGRDRVEVSKDGFFSFSGGDGADTASFTGSGRAWDFDPSRSVEQAEGFTPGDIRNIDTQKYADVDVKSIRETEQIIGSRFDDILRTSNGTASGGDVTNLRGFDGNDQLYSNASNPSAVAPAHFLSGGNGDDLLYGAGGNENLLGGAGNDRFWDVAPGKTHANLGVDSYQGGAGNDRFYFSESTFTIRNITGGDGFDTADFSRYETAVDINLVTSSNLDRISEIEEVRGSQYSDVIEGDDIFNSLIGMNGNDLLRGLGGDDKIYTGRGNDTVDGGSGNDHIFAALGNNIVRGDTGTDTLSFEAYQSGEESQPTTGWVPDAFFGSVVADLQAGLATFTPDDDLPVYETDFSSIENLTGTQSADMLRGDSGANVINGGLGAGADLIEGRYGADILFGGDGADTIYGGFESATQPNFSNTAAVSFNRGAENQQAAVLDTFDMPTDDVTVELLFRANDGVLPSSYMSFFSYAAGIPVDQEELLIFGYTTTLSETLGVRINGNNFLSAVPTSTILDGEIHRLSASYDGGTGAVALFLNGTEIASGVTNAGGLAADGRVVIGQDQDADGLFRPRKTMPGDIADVRVWDEVRSTAEIDALAFVDGLDPLANPALVTNWVPDDARPAILQDVISGADLQLVGGPGFSSFTDGDDTVDGGGGNDLLTGGGGDDNLRGDTGADVLRGESGNDVLSGGRENDVLNGGDGEDVLFAGSGNDLVFGGAGFDKLFGGAGSDRLFGGASNDIVNGGADNDIINTGSGNDLIFGQNGNDLVFAQSGNDDIFGGAGNDKLFGGSGNDEINGGAGNDDIFGGAGVDLINGAVGNDVMSGGGGADRFVLVANQGDDRITDFTGIDRLDISSFGVTDGTASQQDWRDATTSVGTSGGGANVTINWVGGGALIIENIGVASLTDAAFVF